MFHDAELRSLKNFARRYGGIVPYHRWSWQDLERAANPKESPGRKMLKGDRDRTVLWRCCIRLDFRLDKNHAKKRSGAALISD